MSLTIKNLNKNFGKKKIFSDFSYNFSDTGLYLLVADSGVGKTTLLRMISGLDKDFSGIIEGGGSSKVSFAFQEYRLFPNLTALENVTVALKVESEEVVDDAKAFLSTLGFNEEDMLLYPLELSGGMKQRVSLARAFLKKSPVLLLDEPTKELDPSLCKVVHEMINREAKKRLVIVVTHTREDIEALEAIEIRL